MNSDSKRKETEKLLLQHVQLLFGYKSEVMERNGDEG